MKKENRTFLFLILWCILVIGYFVLGRSVNILYLSVVLVVLKTYLDYKDNKS